MTVSKPRIAVTGAAGFIGAHVASYLAVNGAHVCAWVRPGSNRCRLEKLGVDCEIVEVDLESSDSVEAAATLSRAETMVHCAWRGVLNSSRNEHFQVGSNIEPSVRLLTTVVARGCRRFVGLGSQAEYGPKYGAIDELAATAPTTLYGAAKLATFHLQRVLSATAGIEFSWVRIFSTYGPWEDSQWLIPYLIRSLLGGERPALTLGEQKWDFLFVRDAAEAIGRVALVPSVSGVFNLGSGDAPQLREVITMIRDLIDPERELGFGEVPYRPDQVMHLQADTRRLRELVGWNTQTSLREGLRETVEFHRCALAR